MLLAVEWFEPFFFTYDDNETQHLPWQVFNYRTLSRYGELAWMNFHQLGGHANAVAGQSGVYYWPAYVASFLADHLMGTLFWAIDINSLMHLYAAMIALYAYLRLVRVGAMESFYGAVLYLSMPFLIMLTKAEIIGVYSAFYYPAMLFCVEAWWQTRATRWLVAGALLKTHFIYQGNVQFFFLYMALELGYLVCRAAQKRRPNCGYYMVSYGLSNIWALIAALPLLLPMVLELSASSYRLRAGWEKEVYEHAMTFAWWWSAQFFRFQSNVIFCASSSMFFLGGVIVLPWLAGNAWLRQGRERCRNSIWVIWLLWLVVAMVLATSLNALIHWLPPFNQMRWPYKWYQIVILAYPIVCASVWHVLRSRAGMRSGWMHAFFILAIVSNLLVAFSPGGRRAFALYRLPPEVMNGVTPKLGDGRILAYNITRCSSQQAVVEMRGYNFPTLFEEYGFAGYDPIVRRNVAHVFYYLTHNCAFLGKITPRVQEHLNRWGVRYIITDTDPLNLATLQAVPGWREWRRTDSGLWVFENTLARPIVSWNEAPFQAVHYHYGANSLWIDTGRGGGELTVALIAQLGWRYQYGETGLWQDVSIDEQDRQIHLSVPKGVESVTLRFTPPLLRELWYCSLSLLVLIGLGWWGWNWKGRRIIARRDVSHPTMAVPAVRVYGWPAGILLTSIWLALALGYAIHVARQEPSKEKSVPLYNNKDAREANPFGYQNVIRK